MSQLETQFLIYMISLSFPLPFFMLSILCCSYPVYQWYASYYFCQRFYFFGIRNFDIFQLFTSIISNISSFPSILIQLQLLEFDNFLVISLDCWTRSEPNFTSLTIRLSPFLKVPTYILFSFTASFSPTILVALFLICQNM